MMMMLLPPNKRKARRQDDDDDVILSLLDGFSVINHLSIHTVIKTNEAISIEMHDVLATAYYIVISC